MSNRTAVTAGLAIAGVSLAAYPALRPYGPEAGLAGAADFGATAWLVAHALGMLGFVTLAFTLRTAAVRSPWRWSGRPVRETETRAWLAVALLLPYYGAEAYGLNELGRYASDHHDAGVLDVADAFRYAPFEITTFSLGLFALLLVGGRLAHGMWRTGRLGRTGGLLAGFGLVTYLPQFFGTPELRMAHGLVLGLGLVLMAVATARTPSDQPVAEGRERKLAHA
ncbi:hypothetical protein ACT8ZV_21550 [Nocardioides sp. MAHUQ-72]|uniref:hypothetical protein n=1 Tax=unclassified Nocardioides TaxID=2615069 RepID=UPI00361F7EAE